MATFYLILVIILFFLAISDLVVGVSNDAVNFLNSAIGAKAATYVGGDNPQFGFRQVQYEGAERAALFASRICEIRGAIPKSSSFFWR